MAKIAIDEDAPGRLTGRVLARGDGWIIEDVVCTAGPSDRPFEEEHDDVAIAMVVSGSFQYRTRTGRALMTPGSIMLGNCRQPFVCGHEHGTGDRCLSFRYAPGVFEDLAAAAGAAPLFTQPRLPPLPALSPLIARACAGAAGRADVAWDELGVEVVAEALQLSRAIEGHPTEGPPGAAARVSGAIRLIERHPDAAHTLSVLSRDAGLSPYHFLRTFRSLTGVTPHQYVLRQRLRSAALRLCTGTSRIVDVALECGFGDLSAFNRAFRAEFHASPRRYRQQMQGPRRTAV